jgi:hypothetical protein
MTRRVTVLVSCLVAAFAVSAVVAAISSATMVLPVFSGTATSGTGSSTTAKLTVKGGASVTCTASSDSLTFNSGSRDLGPGSLSFTTCSQGGEECHSLGGSGNSISVTGEWHLVLFVKGGVDGHYFLFLLPSFGVHLECPAAAVKLLLVTGDVLGSITQKSGSTTEFTVKVSSTATAQEFSEFENEAGTAVKAKLETVQEGTGAAKESLENAEAGVLKFSTATAIEK